MMASLFPYGGEESVELSALSDLTAGAEVPNPITEKGVKFIPGSNWELSCPVYSYKEGHIDVAVLSSFLFKGITNPLAGSERVNA